jgi:hypothetical protein
LGPAGELIVHGFGAGSDESFDRLGRLPKATRKPKGRPLAPRSWLARTTKPAAKTRPIFAAGRAGARSAVAIVARSAEATAKTGWPDGLTGHHLVEAGEFLCRFLLHCRLNRCGNLVHLMVKAFGLEDRLAEFPQLRQVERLELRHLENTLKEEVLPGPRFVDAQALSLFLSADHVKLAERVIMVPRYKHELPGFGVKIEVEVLTGA